MSATAHIPRLIGRTERALVALMGPVLASTGGTFHEWVVLNLTAVSGGPIERTQLRARVTDALKVDDATVEAAITELAAAGLLETVAGSVVALSDSGRGRYARIRTAIDETTAPLYADIPADDLATTQRVLTTLAEQASALLAEPPPAAAHDQEVHV
jgi:DNA-binding MarR family transcriptional regulator